MDHQLVPADILARISELETRFHNFKLRDDGERDGKENRERFLGILRDTCVLVRDQSSGAEPIDAAIVERVDGLINSAVHFGYSAPGLTDPMFEFIPSFAHSIDFPEVKDTTDDGGVEDLCTYISAGLQHALADCSLLGSLWSIYNVSVVLGKDEGPSRMLYV